MSNLVIGILFLAAAVIIPASFLVRSIMDSKRKRWKSSIAYAGPYSGQSTPRQVESPPATSDKRVTNEQPKANQTYSSTDITAELIKKTNELVGIINSHNKRINELESLVRTQKQEIAGFRTQSDNTQKSIEKSLRGILEELEWRTIDFRRIPRN